MKHNKTFQNFRQIVRNMDAKVLISSVMILVIIMSIDAWLDSTVFYQHHGGFFDLLLYNIPKHELYIRSVISIIILSAGTALAYYVAKIKLLKDQEALLNSLSIQKMPEAVFWLDRQGNILYVNDMACQQLGYTEKELLSMSTIDLVKEKDDFETIWSEHCKQLRAEKRVLFETEYLRKDGTVIPVEIAANFVEWQGKAFNIAFVRDISERRKREHQLYFYRHMVEKSGEAIFALSIDEAKFVFANERAGEFLGYTPEEINGKEFTSIRNPSHKSTPFSWSEHVREVKEKGHIFSEGVHLRKDGSTYPVETTVTYSSFQGEDYIVSFVRDTTEKKQLQTKLEANLKELEAKQIELQRMATHDALTGIYNRLAFEEFFEKRISEAKRHSNSLWLTYFDIDNFKTVNDTYGHEAGDRVLKETTELISQQIRNEDYFARIGGEEFALITVQNSDEDAYLFVEKIREKMATHEINGIGNVTGSFGVTRLKASDTHDTFLKRADLAMYAAKTGGKNKIVIS